nr:GTP-binding protein [uncultured Peptostreptococcus sp.]
MKVLIISGFLGAGKTTFIKELSKRTKREIAILENEYAHVGIDGDTLKNELDNKEINIWELTEGCICCSTKKDFASSVLTIANSVDPEFLVVEPTGVAKLGNIMENIKQLEYERISILPPITIVDGHSFDKYLNEYPATFKNQLLNANSIIVSKFEQASSVEKSVLENKIKKVNDSSNIYLDHYSNFDLDWWNSLLRTPSEEQEIINNTSDQEELPENLSLEDISIKSLGKLIITLESLIRGEYGDIIRSKGSFCISGVNIQFDVADGKYSVLVDAPAASDNVIFIGKDIKRHKLRKIFFSKSGRIILS